MVTVIHEERESDIARAHVVGDALWVSSADASRATGWALRPEGLCRADVCIPAPRGREAEFIQGDTIEIAGFWRLAGHPVVHDAAGRVWVLGTGAGDRSRALHSLLAPDFALPDLHGRVHALSDHRGRKVFLVTWASW